MFNLKIYLKITKYLNNLKSTILLSYKNFKWTILIGYYNFKWTILIGYYNFKWTIFKKFQLWNFLLKKRFKSLKKTIKKRFKTLKWNIKTTFRTLKCNIKTTLKFFYYKIHLLYKKLNIILYNIRWSLLIEVQLNTRWLVKIIYIDIFLITTVILYFIIVIALPMWNAAAHLPVFHLGDPAEKIDYIVTPNFVPGPHTNINDPAIRSGIVDNISRYISDPRRKEDKLLQLMGIQLINYLSDDRFARMSIYSIRFLGNDPTNSNFMHDHLCQELAHRVKISEHSHLYDYVSDEKGIIRLYPRSTPGFRARMDFPIFDAVAKNPVNKK